jgi:hypothetical protein
VPTYLKGDAVARQVCKPFITETGSGSIIRKDAITELLQEPSIYTTEHLLDMLAYPIVAVRYGAAYLPDALAGFRFSPTQMSTSKVLNPTAHFECCEAAWKYLNLDSIRKIVPEAVIHALYRKAVFIRPATGTVTFAMYWNRFMLPRIMSRWAAVRWTARWIYRGMDKLNDFLQFLRYRWLRTSTTG